MKTDVCNAPVALTSQQALDDWNAMIRAFLAHGKDAAPRLGAVLEAEPDFALGHATKGIFSLLMGRRELVSAAHDAAAKLKTLDTSDPRTQAWTDALEAWLNGWSSKSVTILQRALDRMPHDTLTLKVNHAIRFIRGDSVGMRWSVERALDAHRDHPFEGFVLGCHAFALEETGAYTAAERAGRAGLELAGDDAWGLHAVAHVHDMTGQAEKGIALIEQNTSAWDHCNNFRYHVWWHKALLHLDEGETDIVLSLYDRKIREEKTDDFRDIANATSILTRLELEGVSVADRWAELADLSEQRVDDACLAFADLHYMLALAGDRRADAAQRMIGRLHADRATLSEAAQVSHHPGHSVAQGIQDFAEGRYATAFHHLVAGHDDLQTIGGSHAQRDVFERITIDAGIRAGQLDAAEDLLIQRRSRRNGTEDRFAATRFATIQDARAAADAIPAQ
ncbi:MAG: tetratricopeptide repeat protein [Pseudomonadota bacterium]